MKVNHALIVGGRMPFNKQLTLTFNDELQYAGLVDSVEKMIQVLENAGSVIVINHLKEIRDQITDVKNWKDLES